LPNLGQAADNICQNQMPVAGGGYKHPPRKRKEAGFGIVPNDSVLSFTGALVSEQIERGARETGGQARFRPTGRHL